MKIQVELTQAEKNALMDILDEVEEKFADEPGDFLEPDWYATGRAALRKLILAFPP